MNYCDKIHYNIYTTGLATFGEMVDALLAQLPQDEQILRLAFFGMPNDNEQYSCLRRIMLREKIRKFYGNHEPVLSYVSQPPLNAGLILKSIATKRTKTIISPSAVTAASPMSYWKMPMAVSSLPGGLHGDVINFGIQQQSAEVFHMMGEVMRRGRLPRKLHHPSVELHRADHPLRRAGPALPDVQQRPCRFLWKDGLEQRLSGCATGIGANLGGILVDLDAAVFTRSECYATPIDNKLQIAAHAYSDQVLEAAQQKKATPKFERAKSMTFDDRRIVYISGTAAIRGEESLVGVGLGRQLHITMENIGQLIGKAKLKMLRVYLKEKSFYEEARELLEGYNLNIPISYMWADVCRDELLIEIEGIAIE